MAELVDASDSKSDSARSAGSIPARGTTLRLRLRVAYAFVRHPKAFLGEGVAGVARRGEAVAATSERCVE